MAYNEDKGRGKWNCYFCLKYTANTKITQLLLGDEEAFFSKEISSKGNLKSTVSRSYRSRDKGSYGDSHQDDIETYKREMKRQAPPSTDETRQSERRHGDRRRDERVGTTADQLNTNQRERAEKKRPIKRERDGLDPDHLFTQPSLVVIRIEERHAHNTATRTINKRATQGRGLVHTDIPTHIRVSMIEEEENLAINVTSIVLLEI